MWLPSTATPIETSHDSTLSPHPTSSGLCRRGGSIAPTVACRLRLSITTVWWSVIHCEAGLHVSAPTVMPFDPPSYRTVIPSPSAPACSVTAPQPFTVQILWLVVSSRSIAIQPSTTTPRCRSPTTSYLVAASWSAPPTTPTVWCWIHSACWLPPRIPSPYEYSHPGWPSTRPPYRGGSACSTT